MNKNYVLILNAVSYVAVLVINILAQSGTLGGMRTDQISASYLNLFTPSGYTFMIWGLIYLLLGAYIVYQFLAKEKAMIYKIAPFVFMSNVLNILWLLCWHYASPLVSLIVILVLLAFLIMIVRELKKGRLLPKTTFTIYYAWITVASIASFFAFLVSFDETIYDKMWLIILTDVAIGIVGLLMVTMSKNYNIGYLLTLLWATFGILMNHLTTFNGSYLSVMIVSLVVLLIGVSQLVIWVFKKLSN